MVERVAASLDVLARSALFTGGTCGGGEAPGGVPQSAVAARYEKAASRPAIAPTGYGLRFQGQHDWLIGVLPLQKMGFGFFYAPEEAHIMTPDGYLYPLRPGTRTSHWCLRCHSPERGRLVYGEGPGESLVIVVEMITDSGSGINCAGARWREVLMSIDGFGHDATAAGGHRLRAEGQ